jgi:hypothetical protein
MASPSNCRFVCTHPNPRNLALKHKPPSHPNDSPKLNKMGIKCIQKNVGSILYYACVVDMMVLMALSSIAVEQTKATEKTMAWCIQLLDYLSSQVDAKVQFLL